MPTSAAPRRRRRLPSQRRPLAGRRTRRRGMAAAGSAERDRPARRRPLLQTARDGEARPAAPAPPRSNKGERGCRQQNQRRGTVSIGRGRAARTRRFRPRRRVVSAAWCRSPGARGGLIERCVPGPRRMNIGNQDARAAFGVDIPGVVRKRAGRWTTCRCSARRGWAKTTLSHIIANELGVNLRQTRARCSKARATWLALLTNLERTTSVHRRDPPPPPGGRGDPTRRWRTTRSTSSSAKARRRAGSSSTCAFTLVGATTRAGMLTNPLRDRFGIVARWSSTMPRLSRIVRAWPGCSTVDDDRRRGAIEIAPLARHAAHRQPAAAPGARLCRGPRAMAASVTGAGRCERCAGSTSSAGAGRDGPQAAI